MKLFNQLLNLVAIHGVSADQNAFAGDIVLEAVPSTAAQVEFVKTLDESYELDFWFPPDARRIQSDEHFQVRVSAKDKYLVIRDLLDTNMMFRILHNNLDQMVAESIHKTQDEIQFDPSSMGNGFLDRTESITDYDYFVYHTETEIENWSIQMSERYSDFVELKKYGKSIENRDLYALVIKEKSGRTDVPRVLIDCGVHAREWISHSTCQYFIGQLTNPDSPWSYLRNGIEWHVIPNVNPDGYAFSWTPTGRFWRKNRNPNNDAATKAAQKENGANNLGCGFSNGIGVDLNRNYDIMWSNTNMIGASQYCNQQSYRGAHAFSEPEAKFHADYMLDNDFSAYLTMHSYAQVILFPYTFSSRAPRPHNYDEMMALGAKIVKKIGSNWRYGQGRDIFYPAAGGSDDWAHMIAKVPLSFTFELRDDGYYGFMLPERLIQRAVEEATRGISAIYDHLADPVIELDNSQDPDKDLEGSTAQVTTKAPKVVELVTNCATNPNTNFGDYDFNCKMKTGKCTFKCDGTPSHKYVKCKKSAKGYSWWPANADIVKCIAPLDVTKAFQYFKDTTKINSGDVYELHSCKVSGGKKIDCGIRCKSAVNCGKKCHSKAIMVRDKSGNLTMKKAILAKMNDLIKRC